ncbi:RNA-directed DNA polymerase -like protein [Trichinella britovi]|uniref:RNA-directed DNA polymerase-like protein n=1 Tax=Trichinella britovi TaxID=45882 RepID=A0A0V1DK69_TRIBR|nr:RNA-directed DNA polymerase -like protein [Trichinella britovi]
MYSPSFIAPLWEFASVCIRENHTESSYMVAHSLSVATKPYSDGEIVKARIVDAVKCKSEATTFDCSLNCLDYRKRSDVKEAQPVFRIDEIPDMLAGPKWFSTLDFASGYWQAKVRSEDRPKAPFITFMSCRSDCPTLLRLFDDIYDLLKDLNWKVCYLLGCRFTS